jgi:hypothetical protein
MLRSGDNLSVVQNADCRPKVASVYQSNLNSAQVGFAEPITFNCSDPDSWVSF